MSKAFTKMKRIGWLFVGIFLMGAAMAMGDSAPGPTFTCENLSTVAQALRVAARQPNTTVNLDPAGKYDLLMPLFVNGVGTVLEGHGATLHVRFHYTGGGYGGFGIMVWAKLGDAVPFTQQGGDGMWMNPRGTVRKLIAKAGGTDFPYAEMAPCQYAVGEPTAVYADYRPIVTPAEKLIIRNLVIELDDPQVNCAIDVHYGHSVTIENVKVTVAGPPITFGGTTFTGCDNCTFKNCSSPSFGLNSCTHCTVTECIGPDFTTEEMCRWCKFTLNHGGHFRSNDIACADCEVSGNAFAGKFPNFGSMALPGATRLLVRDNKCDDTIWLGGDTQSCTIINNVVPQIANFAKPGSRPASIISGNHP